MNTNHTPQGLAATLGVAALTAAATLGLGMATAGTAHAHGASGGGGAGKVAVGVHEQLITQFAHGSGGGAGKVTAVDQFQRFVNRFAPPPPP